MSLSVVSASAGTGKTERVSREVAEAISNGLDVSGLVAVTYTSRAAAELRGRIRQSLAARGAYHQAQLLPLAYVGTVHAVCRRFLSEFAIAAGLPPSVDVLPESAAESAVMEAVEAGLDEAEALRLHQVCARLRPNWDSRTGEYRWIVDAQDLLDLSRSNRISAADLPAMAARSTASFASLLGERRASCAALDGALATAIEGALQALGDGDGTKATAGTIETLRAAVAALAQPGSAPWATWLRLTKLAPAKASAAQVLEVQEVASLHRHHPRLHDDVADYLRLVYDAVGRGLERYRNWKTDRRYIDYTDMEERALSLFSQADVKDELARRLRLLVVDEFQDTSPIQLALFLEFERLCGRAVWVGDRKQSIFAFRGADPALMEAVLMDSARRGGRVDVLPENFRSRPSLVDLSRRLFVPAFARLGYPEAQVAVAARRTEEDAQASLPALGAWLLDAGNAAEHAAALAEGIERLLAAPAQTPVVDRVSGEVRQVRAGDVALLVATNDEAAHSGDRDHPDRCIVITPIGS